MSALSFTGNLISQRYHTTLDLADRTGFEPAILGLTGPRMSLYALCQLWGCAPLAVSPVPYLFARKQMGGLDSGSFSWTTYGWPVVWAEGCPFRLPHLPAQHRFLLAPRSVEVWALINPFPNAPRLGGEGVLSFVITSLS